MVRQILNEAQHPEQHHGFISHHSTAMSLMDFTDEISSAIDKKQKQYSFSIIVDLKKVLDTNDHSILVRKLKKN